MNPHGSSTATAGSQSTREGRFIRWRATRSSLARARRCVVRELSSSSPDRFLLLGCEGERSNP
jgi:hypothetical protein